MNAKRKAVLERIASLERAIRKAREYLESGSHANWEGLRPLFGRKKELPPHKDWVKNAYLPRQEEALARAEMVLERLHTQGRVRARDDHGLQRTGRAKRPS